MGLGRAAHADAPASWRSDSRSVGLPVGVTGGIADHPEMRPLNEGRDVPDAGFDACQHLALELASRPTGSTHEARERQRRARPPRLQLWGLPVSALSGSEASGGPQAGESLCERGGKGSGRLRRRDPSERSVSSVADPDERQRFEIERAGGGEATGPGEGTLHQSSQVPRRSPSGDTTSDGAHPRTLAAASCATPMLSALSPSR